MKILEIFQKVSEENFFFVIFTLKHISIHFPFSHFHSVCLFRSITSSFFFAPCKGNKKFVKDYIIWHKVIKSDSIYYKV